MLWAEYCPGQCLKASLTLAPACLVLPLNWSARPSVRRRVLPVARPKYFLVAPLAASALWASFLPMLIADSFFSSVVTDRDGGLSKITRRALVYREVSTWLASIVCRRRAQRPGKGPLSVRGLAAVE